MVMSYEQRKGRKIDRWVKALTNDSEFYGLIGKGTDSFYRVYVRKSKTSKWWRFEFTANLISSDPIKYCEGLPPEDRVKSVRGELGKMVKYKYFPERVAIKKLFDRSQELNAGQ
jgi:hypothetical protein